MLVFMLRFEEGVNSCSPLIRVQTCSEYADRLLILTTLSPTEPKQAPLFAMLEYSSNLLLSVRVEDFNCLHNFTLKTIESLKIILLKDDPLELVMSLNIVEVHPFLVRP
jgi:hypothetical protein